MELTRWFHRHRRYLLAGLVVMLMVAWGALGTLSRFAQPRQGAMGSVRGEAVDSRDLLEASKTLQVALRLGMADAQTMYVLRLRGAPTHTEAALILLFRALRDFVFEQGAKANDPEAAWRFLVLQREAEADGVEVTTQELEEAIAFLPVLWDEKSFSVANYRAFLGVVGVSEGEMVACVSRLAKVAKLLCLKRGTIGGTYAELWMSYVYGNEQMRVNYVEVDSSLFLPLVEVSDEQVRAFYDEHKEVPPDPAAGRIGYMAPERVKVEYALAPVDKLAAEVEVAEQDVAKYYEANKEQFRTEESSEHGDVTDGGEPAGGSEGAEPKPTGPQYRSLDEARAEIRGKLAQEKATEKAGELVGTLQRELESVAGQFANEPQPLQQMARRYGLEYHVADAPGGGGLLTRQELEALAPEGKQMAESAFAHDVGLCHPRTILSGEQPVIYQVLERRDPEPLAFDQVAETVRQDCIQSEALDKAAAFAREVKDRVVEVGFEQGLEAMNQRLGNLLGTHVPSAEEEGAAWPLTVKRSDLFGRISDYVPGIDRSVPEVVKAAFKLEEMEVAAVSEGPPVSRCYVIRPAERQEASREAFAEAASMYRTAYVYHKQDQVMLEWMQRLLKSAHRSQKVAG